MCNEFRYFYHVGELYLDFKEVGEMVMNYPCVIWRQQRICSQFVVTAEIWLGHLNHLGSSATGFDIGNMFFGL